MAREQVEMGVERFADVDIDADAAGACAKD